jgi:predicted transcriptional regulator
VDTQDNVTLPQATLQVLSAFAARETATVDDILALARQLPAALAQVATPQRSGSATAQQIPIQPAMIAHPAVPVDQSVTDDTVTCLCCGRSFTMLKRHLKAEHGLTEDQYRLQYDLPEDHPLVAPNYSIRKAEYAKRIGLGKYTREDTPPQSGPATT